MTAVATGPEHNKQLVRKRYLRLALSTAAMNRWRRNPAGLTASRTS